MRQSRTVGTRLLVMAAALGVVLAATDHARANISLAPSVIDARVNVGDQLPEITITNTTAQALDVRAAAAPASQDAAGLPVYRLAPSAIRGYQQIVHLSRSRLRLAPGARETITVTVVGRTRRLAEYGVVAFTAREAGVARRDRGSTVIPTVRLATNLMLRFPGQARPAGRVLALRVGEPRRRRLQFAARLASTGNIHIRPRTTLAIISRGGHVVRTRRFPRVNVLPGAVRDVEVRAGPRLAAGSYIARVSADAAGRRTRVTRPFVVAPDGTLAQPRLSISGPSPARPGRGSPFVLSLRIANRGTAAGDPIATVRLASDTDGQTIVHRRLRVGLLQPGAERALQVAMPSLHGRQYHADVRIAERGFDATEARITVLPGTRAGLSSAARSRAARRESLIAVGLLVVVGVGIPVMAYILRLRRRLRDAERAGRRRPVDLDTRQ